VVDSIVGEETHNLIDVLAFKRFAKITDDFFRLGGHDAQILLDPARTRIS
jgi:hypothetical protein